MFKYIFMLIVAIVLYFAFLYDTTITNESIGKLFVAGILGCLAVFLVFKFGLHYKIQALDRFAISFYYSVFEYKKSQKTPSNMSYMDSVREQAEVALTANFDPNLSTAALKIPVSLYSLKNPFVDNLRARIQEAERMKLEARKLDGKANKIIEETKDILVEKDLAVKNPPSRLDAMFEIEDGVASIIDLTICELKDQSYSQIPDYEIITHIALDNNPYFSSVYKYFNSEDVAGIIHRAPFMIILVGIVGTFSGFYLALNQGGDIKSGAAVAIISSLVGLPVSLLMDYINTLFPDKSRYVQAFNKYKMSLEILFNLEKELENTRRDRRKSDRRAEKKGQPNNKGKNEGLAKVAKA